MKKSTPVSPEIKKLMQQKLDSISATIPKHIHVNGNDGIVTITHKDGSITKKNISDTTGDHIVKITLTKHSDLEK